jgi:hypothetical protein
MNHRLQYIMLSITTSVILLSDLSILQLAIKQKIDSQPFGNTENPLPVRHVF